MSYVLQKVISGQEYSIILYDYPLISVLLIERKGWNSTVHLRILVI